jgi:hypothetical protein
VPVSKAEFDEINAGLKREGIEPIDTGAGVYRATMVNPDPDRGAAGQRGV